MESVRLPAALGAPYERVYLAQFDGVTNGAQLKDALIAASKSDENSDERRRMDYAFVDARLVASRRQLLTAVVEAIVASERVRNGELVGLKTPSVATLTQIADALRRFGVSKATTTLLLVRVARAPPHGPEPGAVAAAMDALVDGTLRTAGVALPGDEELPTSAGALGTSALDWPELAKVYKLRETHDYAKATPASVEPLLCSAVATKFLG